MEITLYTKREKLYRSCEMDELSVKVYCKTTDRNIIYNDTRMGK